MLSVDATVAGILVAVILGVALIFGWRQFWQIRHFRAATPSHEQKFLLRVARRRLIVSFLLALIGVAIASLYLSGLEQAVRTLGDLLVADPAHQLTVAEVQTRKLYLWAWIAILTVLLAIVITVGIDMVDVRRHWRRSLNQIREERREMMSEQLANLRDEHRRAQLDPERN